MTKRTYGWKRDKKDERDLKLKTPRGSSATLPDLVDLRPMMPPVYDQKNLGSCTANSIAAMIQYDEIKEGKPSPLVPSRLFIYYNERDMEGTIGEDSGAQIRDGIKTLNTLGFCNEDLWPYVENKFTDKPSQECYDFAKKEIITQYARIPQTALALKARLALGFPIAFGFTVFDSFESEEVARTGVVPMPQKDEGVCGGHAVLMCGYDSKKQLFLVRNSWSENWGVGGYFWLPEKFVLNPNLSNDFWSLDFA